jgi:excisionase family DNA binding protein
MKKTVLKIDEVKAETGISRGKLYQYIKTGQLKTILVGRSRRVRRIDLREFLESLYDR